MAAIPGPAPTFAVPVFAVTLQDCRNAGTQHSMARWRRSQYNGRGISHGGGVQD